MIDLKQMSSGSGIELEEDVKLEGRVAAGLAASPMKGTWQAEIVRVDRPKPLSVTPGAVVHPMASAMQHGGTERSASARYSKGGRRSAHGQPLSLGAT